MALRRFLFIKEQSLALRYLYFNGACLLKTFITIFTNSSLGIKVISVDERT